MSRKRRKKKPRSMPSISVSADCHTKLRVIAESLGIAHGELVARMVEQAGAMEPRYQPVKPPRVVRRSKSRERQVLGDEAAAAWGFR